MFPLYIIVHIWYIQYIYYTHMLLSITASGKANFLQFIHIQKAIKNVIISYANQNIRIVDAWYVVMVRGDVDDELLKCAIGDENHALCIRWQSYSRMCIARFAHPPQYTKSVQIRENIESTRKTNCERLFVRHFMCVVY